MTRYLLAAALAVLALGAAAIRGWLQRRATARAEATAERLRAERDAANAQAIGAARTVELAAAQRDADHAATVAAGRIEHAPTTGDPVADVRAIDRAARELHAEDRARTDGDHGRAPGVPPRR